MVRGLTSRVSTPPAVMIASAIGRCPVTSSRNSLSHDLSRLRSPAVMVLPVRSGEIPVRFRQTGTISRGRRPRRRVAIRSLLLDAKSRRSRASSFCASRAGLRSMESATFAPSRRASTISPLKVLMTAPSTPNSVNPISPNASLRLFPLIKILTFTLRRVSPAITSVTSPPVSSGTSAGRMGTMVWPTDSARR